MSTHSNPSPYSDDEEHGYNDASNQGAGDQRFASIRSRSPHLSSHSGVPSPDSSAMPPPPAWSASRTASAQALRTQSGRKSLPPPPYNHALTTPSTSEGAQVDDKQTPLSGGTAAMGTGVGALAPPSYATTVSRSISGNLHGVVPTPVSTPLGASLTAVSVPPPLSGPPNLAAAVGASSSFPPPSYAVHQRLAKSTSGSGHPRVTSQDTSVAGTPNNASLRFMPTINNTTHLGQSGNLRNSHSQEGTSNTQTGDPNSHSLRSDGGPPLLQGGHADVAALYPVHNHISPNPPHHSHSQQHQQGGGMTVRVGGTPNSLPHSPTGSFRIPPGGISLPAPDMRHSVPQAGSLSNSSFSGRQDSSSMSIKVGGVVVGVPTPTRNSHSQCNQIAAQDDDEDESFDDDEEGYISRRRADLPPPLPAPANNSSFSGIPRVNSFAAQQQQSMQPQQGMTGGSNSGSFSGTAAQWRGQGQVPPHVPGSVPHNDSFGHGMPHAPMLRSGANSAMPQPPYSGFMRSPTTGPTPLLGVPVPQLNASLSTTQSEAPRDGSLPPAAVQRQCTSLRVTRLPEEEAARIRHIDTDKVGIPDPESLLSFLTSKELVDCYQSTTEFLAAVTVPVRSHFNEFPAESQHQRMERMLNQNRPSSRPNTPAPSSPVPVAVDGHYLLSKVRSLMQEQDPCWMLVHPCPPLLLHMLKAEIRILRQMGVEPVVVFDGITFSVDVHESLVDCRDSLRAASMVWSNLHDRPSSNAASADPLATVTNAEENRKLLPYVKECTWTSEEANDITGIVFRYLVSELRVNAMYAPYSCWAQLGLLFSEGTVAAVMGPPELLAVEAPSLKIITSVTTREIRVLDKSKIVDALFGVSSLPGPIHEFCDRYNTEVILGIQQHNQRLQQEAYAREQRERSMGGGSQPSSPYFSAQQQQSSIRSTPLPQQPEGGKAAVEGLFPFGVPPSLTPMTPIRVASTLFQLLVLCKSPHPRLRYLRPSFIPPHYMGGWECLYRELSMNRTLPNTHRSDIPPPPLYNTFLDLLRDREIPAEVKEIVRRRLGPDPRDAVLGSRAEEESAELTDQLVRGVHCAKLGLLFLTKTPGFSTLGPEQRDQMFGYVQALLDDVTHNSEESVWSGGGHVGMGGPEWCQQRGALMLVAPTATLAMQNALNRHHRPLVHCSEIERVELLESGGKAVDPMAGVDCMGPHSSLPLDGSRYRLPSGQVHPTQMVLGSVPYGLTKVLKQRLPAIAHYLLTVGLISPTLLDTAASKHPMLTTHTPLSDTLELRERLGMMLLIQGQVIGFLAGVLGVTLNKSPEWVRWFPNERGELKEVLFDTQSPLSEVIPTLRHWSLHDLIPVRSSGTRIIAVRHMEGDRCEVAVDQLVSPHEYVDVTLEDALLVVVAKGHAIKFVEVTSIHTHTETEDAAGPTTYNSEVYGWEVSAPCFGVVPSQSLSDTTPEITSQGATTTIRSVPAASPADRAAPPESSHAQRHLEHNGLTQITAAAVLMSLEFLGYVDVNPKEDICCKASENRTGKGAMSGSGAAAVSQSQAIDNQSRLAKVTAALRQGTLRPLELVRILLSHDIVPMRFSPDAAIAGLSDLGCTLLRAVRTPPITLVSPLLLTTHQPTPLGASTNSTGEEPYLRAAYGHLYKRLAEGDQGLLVTLIELVRTGLLNDKPFHYTHYVVTQYKEESSKDAPTQWDRDLDTATLEGRNVDSSEDVPWFENSDMYGPLDDPALALLTRIACLVPVQMHPTAAWDGDYDRRLTTFAQMASKVHHTLRGLVETMAVRAIVGNTTIVAPNPNGAPPSSPDRPLAPSCGVQLAECAGLPFSLPFRDTPSPIGGLLLRDFLTAVPPCPQLHRLVFDITEQARPAQPLTPEEETALAQRLSGGSPVPPAPSCATPPQATLPPVLAVPPMPSSSGPPLINIVMTPEGPRMHSHDGRTRSPLAINCINLSSGWLNEDGLLGYLERKYDGIHDAHEELHRVLRFVRVALWVISEVGGKKGPLAATVERARTLLDHQEGLWAQIRSATSPAASARQMPTSPLARSDGQPPRYRRHNPYQQQAPANPNSKGHVHPPPAAEKRGRGF